MNKQELIEKIDNLQYSLSWNIPRINKEIVLDLIEQLDEPQKVQVPQFVADWYEANKDDFEGNLFRCIDRMPDLFSGEELSDFEEWIVDGHTKPFQILVNMHQFGYTVEKEKRYFVRVKGVYLNNCLVFEKINKKWFFSSIYEIDHKRGHHTRKELEEAGFGWVFDCPEMEVKEVEG